VIRVYCTFIGAKISLLGKIVQHFVQNQLTSFFHPDLRIQICAIFIQCCVIAIRSLMNQACLFLFGAQLGEVFAALTSRKEQNEKRTNEYIVYA
jgi:hypothetical protein